MKVLLLLLLILDPFTPKAQPFQKPIVSGTVIKIVDGDTYDIILSDNTTKRIRMEGIDAPERGMPFYKLSKNYLGSLCFGKRVRIEQTSTDRYGRMVGKTYRQTGEEVGLSMVEAGYAWHFKKYSSDLRLAKAEVSARNKKTGLWAEKNPTAPWNWRKKNLHRKAFVAKRSH